MANTNTTQSSAAARTTIKLDVLLSNTGGAVGTEKVRAVILPPSQGTSKELYAFSELKDQGILSFGRGATKATLEVITTPARLIEGAEYYLYLGIYPYQSIVQLATNPVVRLIVKLSSATTTTGTGAGSTTTTTTTTTTTA